MESKIKIIEKHHDQFGTKNHIQSACMEAQNRLMKAMNRDGFWEGRLSSSPLATAVAIVALAEIDLENYRQPIQKGLKWLATHINSDGGWGDSPESRTNLSTTLLCWSAFSYGDKAEENFKETLRKTETWIKNRTGSLDPGHISKTVLEFYGNDRTFSAPILLLCAIAGRLGTQPDCWKIVPQLPLELAVLPHQLYKWARLPVVSYALPALIAIGLAKHNHSPSGNPITRWLRSRVANKTLDILTGIQPENGGFLEATPLTAFVVMSLASAGYKELKVIERGKTFLLDSQRDDGSWPIDTNLSTWVTTLSINALSSEIWDNRSPLTEEQQRNILNWLLGQQFKKEHVFTHAKPGGWSWTDCHGGVPDADDTSGVLLALYNLEPDSRQIRKAAAKGIRWLLYLQNRDGGIPTFCKGWGKLPFDRSCPDITAHTLLTFAAWQNLMTPDIQRKIDSAIIRGIKYLNKSQQKNGSWLPLWFGNQWSKNEKNPVYGTTQVLISLHHKNLRGNKSVKDLLKSGSDWLISVQNDDGGWGSASGVESTIEETALALRALAGTADETIIYKGFNWLHQHTTSQNKLPASPIGLYFASLWYDEQLYPVIFTTAAFRKIAEIMGKPKPKHCLH